MYTAAVRGFYYFKTFWEPKEKELLRCHSENGKCYDKFTIKTCDKNGRIVGPLPREVSRITKPPDRRKKYQKTPENKRKTATSRDIRQYFRVRQVNNKEKRLEEKSDFLIVILLSVK